MLHCNTAANIPNEHLKGMPIGPQITPASSVFVLLSAQDWLSVGKGHLCNLMTFCSLLPQAMDNLAYFHCCSAHTQWLVTQVCTCSSFYT